MPGRIRPWVTAIFREPLKSEIEKIWRYLINVAIGPTWRLYVHTDDKLYIQRYDAETKKYISKAMLDGDGIFTTTGAQNASTAIDDVGGF